MTDKEIEDYIDSYVTHTIENVEYGNYLSAEILSIVNPAVEECWSIVNDYKRAGTKKRAGELISLIRERLSDMKRSIDELIARELPEIIAKEEEWLDQIGNMIGVNWDYSSKGLSMLGIIPIAAAGSALMYGDSVFETLNNAYTSVVNQGLVTGSAYEDFKDDYEPRFNSIKRGIEADSETLGESLGSQYDRIVFTYNKEKLSKYMWSAMLDSSTCVVCGSMDGTIFDDITKVGMYPMHDRCRCRLLVVPDEVEPELLKESYEHWFERQDEDIKKRILGTNRFQMYKTGWKYKQFVNSGKLTSLKDLSKKVSFSSDKAKEILNKQQPVNSEILSRVIKGLEKNGYSVQMGKDTDKLLELWGKEAYVITTNDGKAAIVFHSKLSASGLFEEIIHTAQTRKFGYEYCQLHTHELEVEAKIKLLKYAKSYGITDYEKEVIKEDLMWHKSQIKEE